MARVPGLPPPGPGGVVSFTRERPAGVQTLDQLMARQKELAQRRADLGTNAYPGQGTIAGGLGNMLSQYTAARDERAAAEQEASSRAALAELIGSWNPDAANAQQTVGQISQYDPDLSTGLLAQLAQSRRDKQAMELAAGQRTEDRAWSVEDREDAQAAAVEQARARAVADAATPLTTQAKLAADLKANRIDQATFDAGMKKANTSEGVTINTGDASSALRKKFDEKEGELWNGYVAAGTKASALTQDMALLDELGKVAPQGPVPGAFQKMFPGISNAGAAYTSVVTRLAPQMRVEGSGATSDIEYLGMVNSLPKLGNYPEANQLIGGMMKAKAAIDMDRANIVTQWRNQQLDDAAARTQLNELNRRSIMTPELRELIAAVGPAEEAPAAGEGYQIRRLD